MVLNDKAVAESLWNESILNDKYNENKDKYQDHALEQYKIYVEMADKISARRATVNSFFPTINTAVVALVSYINVGYPKDKTLGFYWFIGLAGIVLCYMWYRLIRSYRDLNTSKFKVIQEMERRLPLRPYDAEWEAVGRGKNRKLYLPFTHIEVGVPWVFLCIHAFVLIRSVL